MADLWGYMTQQMGSIAVGEGFYGRPVGYMTQYMGSIAVCEGFYGRPAGVYGTIKEVHSNLGGVI